MAFCGGDSFCYYDMLVTGDSVFARDTLSTVHEVARNTELLRTGKYGLMGGGGGGRERPKKKCFLPISQGIMFV